MSQGVSGKLCRRSLNVVTVNIVELSTVKSNKTNVDLTSQKVNSVDFLRAARAIEHKLFYSVPSREYTAQKMTSS